MLRKMIGDGKLLNVALLKQLDMRVREEEDKLMFKTLSFAGRKEKKYKRLSQCFQYMFACKIPVLMTRGVF